MKTVIPSYDYEQSFIKQGFLLVAGVDEAGRAPLAGHVAAGAVILDATSKKPWLDDV
ncbi:MAG: ribonuclease HII, partial [Dehalococcoidales bacterium]|nr:ribonuclease HII [Dehalococcoidales bacterium]